MLLIVPAAAQSQSNAALRAQLTHHLKTLKKDRQVVRFFETRHWLLSDARFEAEAKLQLGRHRASLLFHRKELMDIKTTLRKQARFRKLRQLEAQRRISPATAICRVFGSHCHEALAVSRCESGLRTDAHNGQYLGLFQMGSKERHLFGHGPTAIEQVTAAHRYFVASGASWRPWSCKPWN